MHKLLLSWCDSRRSWTLSPSREGDYQHLVSLYNDWSENNILPFLVIHICFCIHDYRRMGKVFEIGGNQVAFPGFENLLRTIVVPLNELFIFFREINFAPERNQFKVRYFRCSTAKARNESAQDFWNRISLPENHCAMVQIDGNYERELQIINLPDWRNMVVSHFLNRKNA